MNQQELVRELAEKSATKIVMVVADGLGGLPLDPGGRTELETANTPHLDSLVRRAPSLQLTADAKQPPVDAKLEGGL